MTPGITFLPNTNRGAAAPWSVPLLMVNAEHIVFRRNVGQGEGVGVHVAVAQGIACNPVAVVRWRLAVSWLTGYIGRIAGQHLQGSGKVIDVQAHEPLVV